MLQPKKNLNIENNLKVGCTGTQKEEIALTLVPLD